MPYIPKEDRIKYNKGLLEILHQLEQNKWHPGHFNYIVSVLLNRWFEYEGNYRTVNEILGVLDCIGKEFYRKKAVPYEENKEKENGRVY